MMISNGWCCLNGPLPEGCMGHASPGRLPEPTMTNVGRNAGKNHASIPQDTAVGEHNTRKLVAFCQGCWCFIDFWHNKGKIAAKTPKIENSNLHLST